MELLKDKSKKEITVKIERVIPIADGPYFIVYRNGDPIKCFTYNPTAPEGDLNNENKNLNDAIALANILKEGKKDIRENVNF